MTTWYTANYNTIPRKKKIIQLYFHSSTHSWWHIKMQGVFKNTYIIHGQTHSSWINYTHWNTHQHHCPSRPKSTKPCISAGSINWNQLWLGVDDLRLWSASRCCLLRIINWCKFFTAVFLTINIILYTLATSFVDADSSDFQCSSASLSPAFKAEFSKVTLNGDFPLYSWWVPIC
jgi:hypothetical protein